MFLTGPKFKQKLHVALKKTFSSRRATEIHPPSKDKALLVIGFKMNVVIDTRMRLWFHIWFITTLYYQNVTNIDKNATAILLQNAKKVYYIMRQLFYYKMQQLLQNTTILLQDATVQGVMCKKRLAKA